MVVALSEEIWYQTYHTTLATMDLSARLLRYVDNRLCLARSFVGLWNLFQQLFAPGVLGQPLLFWKRNQIRSSWGFCIEFEPFALRYSPPRDFNQVMAPFSASPLAVQLSGCVSRLFLVAKCPTRTDSRLCRVASFVQELRAFLNPI